MPSGTVQSVRTIAEEIASRRFAAPNSLATNFTGARNEARRWAPVESQIV
jgi:hypothetical protein